MNQLKLSKRKALGHSLLVAAVALVGCTKERGYKEVYKDSVYNSGVKEGIVADEFIYVPSQVDAPHSTNGTMPGSMGQERIVRFHFTEKELIAETVIDDERFKEKTLNAKPVMSIPVQHVDYRCADNGVGECSNQEEEVNNVDWKLKKSFKPAVEGMRVEDANTLPIELDQLLGENCHTLLGTRVISADFQPDSIQIEVEKTYRSNVECLTELDSLSDLTFNVRQIHSFVKRKNLISKDYEPVLYPQTDENTFGFFTTETHRLSIDYSNEEKGDKVMMNRWNPTRKIIPYYLTANFFKPENAALKEATLESINAVNNALKEAKVDLQIQVSDKKDANFADVRNSMIVLIEDPQANGVLGYGPAIADPRTGEILAARVVMYAGTMRSQLRMAWNELIEEEKLKNTGTETTTTTAPKVIKLGKKNPTVLPPEQEKAKEEAHAFASSLKSGFNLEAVLKEAALKGERVPVSEKDASGPFVKLNERSIQQFQKELMLMRERFPVEGKILDEEDVQAKRHNQAITLAKFNYYPMDLVNLTGDLKLASLEGLKELPRKPWADLSDAEQEKIVKVMLPYIWVPTLVHELGHNMGLRHNFAGSEDKPNFYSEEELKKYGHSHAMAYSSVMDYSYRSLNELRVMGKYDVAALRYAYRREVEKKDGTILKLTKPLAELSEEESSSLKDFKFCTDGNVGVNPGCRRFDEGTTLTEIAQNLLNAHEERYKLRNFRNGRKNFSITTDKNYVQRIADIYSDMRQFFEVYDMIQTRFGIPENHPAWEANAFLKDVKSAVMISRKAMLEPASVPSVHCVVENDEGIEAVPMEAIGGVYPSCFHEEVVKTAKEAGYSVVGQFGRQFTSEKYTTSTNPYADQIDVRGYWADKLLGPIFLTTRTLGISSFDKYRGNFLDRVGGTIGSVVNLMDGYLNNEVTTNVDVQLADGSTAKLKDFKFSPNATHRIPAQPSRGLRTALRLPNYEVPFSQALLTNVLGEMWDSTPSTLARAMRSYYGIYAEPKFGDPISNYNVVEVDGKRYFIHKAENAFANTIYTQLKIVTTLDRVKKDRMLLVLKAALEAEKPEEEKKPTEGEPKPAEEPVVLTEAEQAAVALGSKAIIAYLNDEFQSAGALQNTIRIIGEVNKVITY